MKIKTTFNFNYDIFVCFGLILLFFGWLNDKETLFYAAMVFFSFAGFLYGFGYTETTEFIEEDKNND